jgi:predicted permease
MLGYALRNLRRSPVFTTVAILSLALGIGANTAIFSLLDQVLLRTLPVKNPRELVTLYPAPGPFQGSSRCDTSCMSYPAYRDLRDRNQVFTGILARWAMALSFSSGDRTERVRAELVSGNYFDVLGLNPALGRVFTQDDDRAVNGHPVVVLTYGFWQSRFGGDPGVLNRAVRVDGQPMTIVGVAARGFDGLEPGKALDLMVPMMEKPLMTPNWPDLENRQSIWLTTVARLKPGVSRTQAEAGIQPVWRSILEFEAPLFTTASQSFRDRYVKKPLLVADASKGESELRRRFSQPLVVLMAMVGLVLLIACANVANLLLARAASRQREIAIRLALGAGRARVVAQLLTESTVLALAGGAAGIAVAAWSGRILLRFLPEAGTALTTTPDVRVLAFAFGLSLATGVLFGLVPALQATRPAIAPTLKDQASNVSSSARLRNTLVVSQVAISLVLLVGAGLFARSLYNLRDVDPGFRASHLTQFTLDASLNAYRQPRIAEFYHRVEDSLRQMAGVTAVASVEVPPLSGDSSTHTVRVEGYESKPQEDMNPLINWVGAGYFSAMGIPLIAGREFTAADMASSPKVSVINQTMARYFFGNANPLGRHLGYGPGKAKDVEIVGVVRDSKYLDLREKPARTHYIPWTQDATLEQMTFFVRSNAPVAAQAVVAALDPDLPVYGVETTEARIADSIYVDRMIAALSSFFGALATLLAAIGLYGVMAYSVARRTREIGVRMALGARRENVLWMVLRQTALLSGIGIGLALPLSFGLGRAIQSQLYGVSAGDFRVIAASAILLAFVSAAAGYFPALRATRVDPLTALRHE